MLSACATQVLLLGRDMRQQKNKVAHSEQSVEGPKHDVCDPDQENLNEPTIADWKVELHRRHHAESKRSVTPVMLSLKHGAGVPAFRLQHGMCCGFIWIVQHERIRIKPLCLSTLCPPGALSAVKPIFNNGGLAVKHQYDAIAPAQVSQALFGVRGICLQIWFF